MLQNKVWLGEVSTESTLPSISTLAEVARESGIQGSRGNRKYIEKVEEGDGYLYLFFTQEVTEERQQFIDDEETNEVSVGVDDTFIARSMRFLLREDQYYAFQSTRGVSGHDAIEFLLNEFDITGLETTRRETFPDSWMQSFYDTTHSIRKVKLGEIGERESDKDFDEELLAQVRGAGDPAERIEVSTAGRDNNIRTATLLDAIARTSTLRLVNGRDSEGELTKLNKTGRLTFSYPADLDHEGQAERMNSAVDRILRNI